MENVYVLQCDKDSYDDYFSWIESIHKTIEGANKAKEDFDNNVINKRKIHDEYIDRYEKSTSNDDGTINFDNTNPNWIIWMNVPEHIRQIVIDMYLKRDEKCIIETKELKE